MAHSTDEFYVAHPGVLRSTIRKALERDAGTGVLSVVRWGVYTAGPAFPWSQNLLAHQQASG